MKKTLCTVLLCLGVAATAFAESSYTLGNVTYTTKTGLTSWNGGSYSSFTFTLSNSLFSTSTNTADTSNALTTASNSSLTYASDKVALTSIALVLRNGDTTSDATTLVIKSGNTVVATSTGTTTANNRNVDIFNNNTLYTRPMQTFTFNNDYLTVGTTYTAYFQNAEGVSQDVVLAASYNGENTDNNRTGGTVAASLATGWQPAGMLINTTSLNVVPVTPPGAIPEPATATLSLLALAGLAARRRRK